MGANFKDATAKLILAEGKTETNDPHDHGRDSKYGISQRAYPSINISELTESEALDIYERDFWKKYSLDSVNSQEIATQFLLLLVNMNPEEAIKIMQTAINSCSDLSPPLIVDGHLGFLTMNSINSCESLQLSDRIRIEAITFYLKRTDEDSSQRGFLRSWVRRALL